MCNSRVTQNEKERTKKNCDNEGIAYCEVLEIIPHKKLSYSWKEGKGDDKITIDSVVTWTIVEKDNGTELLLEHIGFTELSDFISHNDGWSQFVNQFIDLF